MGRSGTSAAAHGRCGSSSATGTPGSSGRRRPVVQRTQNVVAQLLQPLRGQIPVARAHGRSQPGIELLAGQEGPPLQVFAPERLLRSGENRQDDRSRVAALQEREPRFGCLPRRGRVEHCAAAQRRALAEDDAVAPRGHDGRGQPQLRVTLSDANDATVVLRRPVVHVEPGAVGESVRGSSAMSSRYPTGYDRGAIRASPRRRSPLHAGESERDPLARFRLFDRPVVHLDAPHAHVEAGGLRPQPSPSPTRPTRGPRRRSSRSRAG